MDYAYIDFETKSHHNIKKTGAYKYVRSPEFAPLCMAYAVNNNSVDLWVPGQPFPTRLFKDDNIKIASFNAEFEYVVLRHNWWEWHDIFIPIRIQDMLDIQALGRLFGFPAALKDMAYVLGVEHQKSASGTRLINLLSVVKPGKIHPTPETNPKEFHDMYEYCKQDVRTARDIHQALIKKELSPFEHEVFCHMIKQNERGLPVDIDSVHVITGRIEEYVNRCNSRLYDLTSGDINKGTQVQKITQFIRKCGYKIDNINAETVSKVLDNGLLDHRCREILKIRQQVSHSSTAKFKRIIEMVCEDDSVKGNLKYYGGHTGRFAGVGFQVHNLPRAKHDDPDAVIQDFKSMPINELMDKYINVGAAASKLIRPMIKAPKGKMLMVADYVSIENVLLHWVANDTRTTEDFRNELDQYKVYASRRFGVRYEDVTYKQRTYAKPCVLGLGYGGGASALQRVASGYGVELSETAAENDKEFYRNLYPMIPSLWYSVSGLLIRAIKEERSHQLRTGTVTLVFVGRKEYAFILLPSGRFLAYPKPIIQRDYYYGREVMSYMGVDSMTKKWRRLGDQYRTDQFGNPMPDMPIHGGRLVENIIQALARDLLVWGALLAEDAGYPVIGTVHDEVITEVDETVARDSLDDFCKLICELPKWAIGLPLRAEGYVAKRYRKD